MTIMLPGLSPAHPFILGIAAKVLAPRQRLTVSEWADAHRKLSTKSSSKPGDWRTNNNPMLREPMDCMSARSRYHEAACVFPIQSGKSEIEANVLGYSMEHNPGPIMVALPGEVSMNKWVNQKLNPLIENTPAVQALLTSVASRDAANSRTFKDFAGGQLYVEHAGSPQRLKSTSVKILIVDELDEVATALTTGDDPEEMLAGRTSAFPATYKRIDVSTPTLLGVSRIWARWLKSSKGRYHVPCPHCGHLQPLEWSGLHWTEGGRQVWYVCRDCGAMIEEHHKPQMLRDEKAGGQARWVHEVPDARIRGYHANCLYYQIGLGPRWAELVRMWLEAQGDQAKLKTFINDRLAEPFEDPSMRAVKHNLVAERAEDYRLRTAPYGVLAITAGVDTQDNRLAVQIVGWGRGMRFWVLDYVELPGDPANEEVWVALTELLNRPIQHASGVLLRVLATAIDSGGHRTEAVKYYCSQRRITRAMCIYGATQHNARTLGAPKADDVNWRGRSDKHGVIKYQVGVTAIKHHLYSILSVDAGKDGTPVPIEKRQGHFSVDLPPEYYHGLTSETYDPRKNNFTKRRGARNEPLDTWNYAYAAAHHPELRLHRRTLADWAAEEARLGLAAPAEGATSPATPATPAGHQSASQAPAAAARAAGGGVGKSDWSRRL